MKEGILKFIENEWVVQYDEIVTTPTEDGWIKVNRISTNMAIHTEHSMWLKMFAKEGMEVCFTSAVFENVTKAILKACGPDTHEYVQD